MSAKSKYIVVKCGKVKMVDGGEDLFFHFFVEGDSEC